MLPLRTLAAALTLLVAFILGIAPGTARADFIQTVLVPFTGADALVDITFDDAGAGPGEILVTVTVDESVSLGDLRAVFFDISDPSLLDGLMVDGALVTDFQTGWVIDMGQGANVHGGGSPCPCDIGVEFGTPGIGKDDIQSATFVLSHEDGPLDLDVFALQNVAARLTSVGSEGDRDGSSKLGAVNALPVPEPGTAALLAAGILGLAGAGRRKYSTPF